MQSLEHRNAFSLGRLREGRQGFLRGSHRTQGILLVGQHNVADGLLGAWIDELEALVAVWLDESSVNVDVVNGSHGSS